MPRCGACNTEVASFVRPSSTKTPKVWIAAGAGSENISSHPPPPEIASVSSQNPLLLPPFQIVSPASGNHSRGSDSLRHRIRAGSLRRRIRAGLGSVQLPLQIQSLEMPESRDGRRAPLADLSGGVGGGGFFIRRVASPGSLAVRGAGKPLARRYMSPSRNKENLLPVWALRATPTKKSPLPGWYPRTPLRDITAIAKAIQRSRARIAAAQQQSQRTEQSPQSVNVTTPAQAEQDAPHIAETSHPVASGSGSAERGTVANPATVLADDNLNVSSSPAESSLNTPSKPMDPALADIVEKKLSSSIEKIEKLVRKNMKRTPKAARASRRATQRRNLMSMR